MAKQWGSYMGGFSGKLGTAVGYMWNGIWVMRSRPSMVRNPRTEKQMEQRMLFKQEVQLAARMRRGVNQGLTALARQSHMTAYNLFVSLNQRCFSSDEGRLAVDWQGLTLSEGPVAPVLFGAPELDERGVLTVPFDRNSSARRARTFDRVYLYVYCPEEGEGVLTAPVERCGHCVRLLLPNLFAGKALEIYGFVQNEKGEGSPTMYIPFGEDEGETLPSEDEDASLQSVDKQNNKPIERADMPLERVEGVPKRSKPGGAG